MISAKCHCTHLQMCTSELRTDWKAACCHRVIFSVLYLLLEFGHETPEMAAKLDPPDSYFRLRLVCKLLEACGHYFSSGSASARLERFLTCFQRYLLAKPSLPFDVEFDVQVSIVCQCDQLCPQGMLVPAYDDDKSEDCRILRIIRLPMVSPCVLACASHSVSSSAPSSHNKGWLS